MTMIYLNGDPAPSLVHPLDPNRIGPEGLRARLFRLLDEEAPAIRSASRELEFALEQAEAQLGGRNRSANLLPCDFDEFDDGVAL